MAINANLHMLLRLQIKTVTNTKIKEDLRAAISVMNFNQEIVLMVKNVDFCMMDIVIKVMTRKEIIEIVGLGDETAEVIVWEGKKQEEE